VEIAQVLIRNPDFRLRLSNLLCSYMLPVAATSLISPAQLGMRPVLSSAPSSFYRSTRKSVLALPSTLRLDGVSPFVDSELMIQAVSLSMWPRFSVHLRRLHNRPGPFSTSLPIPRAMVGQKDGVIWIRISSTCWVRDNAQLHTPAEVCTFFQKEPCELSVTRSAHPPEECDNPYCRVHCQRYSIEPPFRFLYNVAASTLRIYGDTWIQRKDGSIARKQRRPA